MTRLLAAIAGNAFGLWVTTRLVPGITFRGGVVTLVVAGVVWGLVNLIVKPIAVLLSLPLLILTLGLFYLVLNGVLLWLASSFMPGYVVGGLVPGILGALVMTVVNWAVGALVGKKD
jgi:putative membrane protein